MASRGFSVSRLPLPVSLIVSFPTMDSRTAAHVLSEISELLALRAENRFKSRAYRTAGKAILALNADDLTPLYRSGEVAKVKGVGRATLAVIGDLIENGESTYLAQ